MKKYVNYFISSAIMMFLLNVSIINAQSVDRAKTKAFLLRTNMILSRAKGAVEVGKVYTGDLVKAVHHQKYARSLFQQGEFIKAINHSYRARLLAFDAIKANKGQIASNMQMMREEQAIIKKQPDPSELDKEVKIPKGADDKSVLKEKEEELKEN